MNKVKSQFTSKQKYVIALLALYPVYRDFRLHGHVSVGRFFDQIIKYFYDSVWICRIVLCLQCRYIRIIDSRIWLIDTTAKNCFSLCRIYSRYFLCGIAPKLSFVDSGKDHHRSIWWSDWLDRFCYHH